MLTLSAEEAYANLMKGAREKKFRYPTKLEPGFEDGFLLPKVSPSFLFVPGERVFTIGSCFARELETRLVTRGYDLPVAGFSLPPEDFPYPAPHLLNEYNAGTILQRIQSVFGRFSYMAEMGIEEMDGGCLDLFLHINQNLVSKARVLHRRQEIGALYDELRSCSAVVITLGLVEAWFDQLHKCFLNKAPSRALVRANPGRFVFSRMDFEDANSRISEAIELINRHVNLKIILTVSPVPLEATFSANSAIVENFYSKAVLRATAQLVAERFDNVDYFPSYEIAMSRGMGGFADDNVHVAQDTVEKIMDHLAASYLSKTQATTSVLAGDHYIDAEVRRLGGEEAIALLAPHNQALAGEANDAQFAGSNDRPQPASKSEVSRKMWFSELWKKYR